MKFVQAIDKKTVESDNLQAYKIISVSGGCMVFDTADEYKTWSNQK